jgi:two-component system, chemotaxis family, CheB/CheR fusion protein
MIRPDRMPTRLRVLIAEDEPATAFTTAALLRMDGHEVFVAGDGPTALEAVEAYDPDVLLLDIGLPGVDGCEVARRVKTRNALKTPLLVAMTGYIEDADRKRSAEAGIDLYWAKPVEPELLQRLLKRFQNIIG